MEKENQKLPFQLSEDMGAVRNVELRCPGVYYVVTSAGPYHVAREHYVVLQDAVPSIISPEVIAYGRPAGGGTYEFEHEVMGSGWELVEFEIIRYKTKRGIAPKNDESLYATAIYEADRYPEYFGGHIPPRMTPWGLTIRWKKASEGIFFLETDRCEWVLALAQPFWSIDLSDVVQGYGEECEADLQLGAEEAVYRYFRGKGMAPAIFELLDYEDHRGLLGYIHSKEALETYLYDHCLEYVLQCNAAEMSGKGRADMLENLLAVFGCFPPEENSEQAQKRREASCIHYYPELANVELLRLPK